MKTPTSRARLAVSAAVTAGLCLAGTAALATPSQAATGTCDTAFPTANLVRDQLVTGKTVSQGTTPGDFNGKIIGVLQDGIEPGVDMVVAELHSTDIDSAGIWAGMSGSPVYAQNGDLIGAVSYTLSWGETQVAGITPWEDMQKYAGQLQPPAHVAVSDSMARQIANRTDVTTAQAAQGFHELRAPALVAGVSQRVLDQAAGQRKYLGGDASAAGTAPVSPGPSDIVAGGNLVATMATGDITIGGLGTVTSVCNNHVVGFGHPMNFLGKTTYGLAGADTLYIQPDSLGGSYKVANIGDLLGTIDQDRGLGISGDLGPIPDQTAISSTVNYTPDGGTLQTHIGTSDVQFADAAAETAFYQLVTNHQYVLDAYQPGSESQSWTVTGHTVDGPFTLEGSNLYTDTFDITYGSAWDVPDLLWLLSRINGVTIDSVDVTSDVNDSTDRLHIKGMEQRRGGAWVTVDKEHPALAHAGKRLTLRLLFQAGQNGHKFSFDIPAKAAGMRARMYTYGAASYPFERNRPHTLAGVQKLVDNMTRNDQARVYIYGYGEKTSFHQTATTPSEGKVIAGHGRFKVKIS
ncbi:MAG TPA: hypothetical protein VHR35_12840 [Nocardioides sp.]|jgi:hypothetical protein|nr:hypothetical protein [Nocardioides sp.]